GEGRRRRYSLEGRGGQEPGGPGEDGWIPDTNGGRREQRYTEKREVSVFDPNGPWHDAIWIPCADGKARRIKPGLEPLVDGVPGRVALLRGAGNAIVPQVAAAFIRAYMEAVSLVPPQRAEEEVRSMIRRNRYVSPIKPWKHQAKALKQLHKKGSALLWADVGIGKTKIAVDYALSKGFS